jgi:ubiquinone/menaquinone biosynthesis C-methylase UbiE
MKTTVSRQNPFGLNAKGYLWEYLAKYGRSGKHLDYGAHDAHMLVKLKNTGMIAEGIGVDLNSDAVARAQDKLTDGVTLIAIQKNPKLPFSDQSFDTTSIVGVLEHILDQDHILQELIRVTKAGGYVFVAVPGKHFFSFLDMGNWKFVFPKVHKFFYTLLKSKEAYHSRYAENKDGLFGDVEIEKGWHEHFSKSELEKILERNGLEIVETDGFGFFFRIFVNAQFFMPGPVKKIFDPLIKADSRMFSSAEIWCMAKKPSA